MPRSSITGQLGAATPEENPEPIMAAGQRTLKATRPAAIHDEVLDERCRVHRLSINYDLKVQVASRGIARRADSSYRGTAIDLLPNTDPNGVQMVVGGLDPTTVVDNDSISATIRAPPSFRHGT